MVASKDGISVEIDGVEIQSAKVINKVSVPPTWRLSRAISSSKDNFAFTIRSRNRSYRPEIYSDVHVVDRTANRRIFGGKLIDASERRDGVVTEWECAVSSYTQPLSKEVIEYKQFLGYSIFEMLANPKPIGSNPEGIFYDSTLSDDIVTRDADGNVIASKYILREENIEDVAPLTDQTIWNNSSVYGIWDSLLDGSGAGLVGWVDPNRVVHSRFPLNIDVEPEPIFDQDFEILEDVIFSQKTGNLINKLRLTGTQNAASGVENEYRAVDPQQVTLPILYTAGTGSDVIEVRYNTGTGDPETNPVWVDLKVERDTTGSFTDSTAQVLWNEVNRTLTLRQPLSFQLIANAVQVRGTVLTGETVDMVDETSVRLFGRREDVRPGGDLVGRDQIVRRAQGIINTSHLDSFSLELKSPKFVDIGTVGKVNIPDYTSIPENAVFMVVDIQAAPRSDTDNHNIRYTYTLGLLSYVNSLTTES